jgi:uncharacterized protein
MIATEVGEVASALFELVLFSLPSLIWTRRLESSGYSRAQSLSAVGLRWGTRRGYELALVVAIPEAALGALLLAVIPSHVLHGGSKNLLGAPSSVGGYAAVVLLALAEEMLFRGFAAGVLFRRFGFRSGNILQALIFVAPHALLLLVSVSLWPFLPLQLIAGLALGWLRERSGSVGPCWLAHALANLLPAILFNV